MALYPTHRASIIQHGDTEVHHAEKESVSKPAVMRPGVNGKQCLALVK